MEKTDLNSGNRFLAGLFGIPCVTVPVALGTALLAGSSAAIPFPVADLIFLLSIPSGFILGRQIGPIRGDYRWKYLGMASGILAGAAFGQIMEGVEGSLWGGLAGVIPGWFYGLYAPWIAWKIPSRFGAMVAWAGLGILMTLVPMLGAFRLCFGKFDGDQIPYVILAVIFGIWNASRNGWWNNGEVNPSEVRRVIGTYLRLWRYPHLSVWVAAIVLPGLLAGPLQIICNSSRTENLHITLAATSWWWPVCLLAASFSGILIARKCPGVRNLAYLGCCAVAALFSLYTITGYLRFDVFASAREITIRHGILTDIRIPRTDLASIETGAERGRRHSAVYPVLVTRSGVRHSLRDIPHSDEIKAYLHERWGTPVNPP